jgi:hypothetical protein
MSAITVAGKRPLASSKKHNAIRMISIIVPPGSGDVRNAMQGGFGFVLAPVPAIKPLNQGGRMTG